MPQPERRTFTGEGWAGVPVQRGAVTPLMAESLGTVVACVNAVSSGLAALPACVYRDQDGGRVEAPGHPVSRLIRAPNSYQTWPDWLEFSVAQLLLRGNSLSVVERDGAGRPTALQPIPWEWLQVEVLGNGRIVYAVTMYGPPRRYLDSEVLHLKDRMDGPYVGRSRISRAEAVLDGALGLQTYSSSVWHNGASPSGVLTLPPNITADGKRRIETQFNEMNRGAHNAKRVLFADKDSVYTPVSVSPEDAEVLASRKFSVIEICRLFNVPPPIVQDYSNNTFTNAAQASLWFASNTLAPIARKVEAEFSRSIFTDPAHHLEIDLSGLLRGDYATRWTANVAAVGAGILTKDEIRAQEGYPPLADADLDDTDSGDPATLGAAA